MKNANEDFSVRFPCFSFELRLRHPLPRDAVVNVKAQMGFRAGGIWRSRWLINSSAAVIRALPCPGRNRPAAVGNVPPMRAFIPKIEIGTADFADDSDGKGLAIAGLGINPTRNCRLQCPLDPRYPRHPRF
jgi:hypothetical protein